MMTTVRDAQISLRLPSDLLSDLRHLAEADDRSMSSLVVKVLREYATRELASGKAPKAGLSKRK